MSNIKKAPLWGLLFIIICLINTVSFAQNRIILNDGSVINNAEIKELKTNIVVFLQSGSLHDMETAKIKWIEKTNGETLYFDEKGTVYSKHNTIDSLNTKKELRQASSKTYIIDSSSLIDKNFERRNLVYTNNNLSAAEALFQQGQLDAKSYYHSPATTLLGFVVIPTSVFGVGGAVANICTNKPINYIRNNNPNLIANTKNPDYINGFRKGMQNKKIGNTVGGIAIFCGLVAGIFASSFLLLH